MPYDPDAHFWLNARVLLAEHGEEVGAEVHRLKQQCVTSGRIDDVSRLMAVMEAVDFIKRQRDACRSRLPE